MTTELRILALYLRAIERLLAELPAEQRESTACVHAEGQTRFLRELIEEQRHA